MEYMITYMHSSMLTMHEYVWIMCACIHSCINVCSRMYVYVYATYVYACCFSLYVCAHMGIFVCIVCMYVCMYICMYVFMYAYMYVCMYVSMYLCMYVCMY